VGGLAAGLLVAGAAALLLRRRLILNTSSKHATGGGGSAIGDSVLNAHLLETGGGDDGDSSSSSNSSSSSSSSGGGISRAASVRGGKIRSRDFALPELEAATESFSERRKLAEGAYGAVFRGVLADGRAVAIKVLTRKDDPAAKASQYSGENSFALEAKVLGKYRHANIVGLVGQCLGDAQPLQYLVYEFMPGGSLYDRIGAESGQPPLTWQQRLIVASDAARGIEYLHVDADPPIIHQDVKSDNILLGEYQGQLVAKIADFGAVRIAPSLLVTNVSHFTAREVIGTKPYQAPEYAISGHVSEKTDTFALGVVLLELLTGRAPVDEANEFLYVAMDAMLEEPEQLLPGLLDAQLAPTREKKKAKKAKKSQGQHPPPQQWPLPKALALAGVAKRCVALSARKRCTVNDVLVELDVLAGRQAIRRAGRGEEYDPMTGELVRIKQ
jgi:serine/threonine protein kinase